ncbi:MAG TPA: alpha/beta fold hydrolase [Candidatus Eisenbacteria bacterium]|nr:alpha/beta fold hydrolase [Candidatus Eisenbacteria bacterium]
MRAMRRTLLLVAVLLVVAASFVGWQYSIQILGPDKPAGRTGQRVIAHGESTITLANTPKARRPGHWAIVWPGGHGKIGPLISVQDGQVITRFTIVKGTPPDTTCRLAGFAVDADPRTWLGVDFDEVKVPSRVGPLPAWRIPGRDSTWAIFVHGRAASRAEVLRMLPAYMSIGLPCLILSYRNDAGAPVVGDGSYRLGFTEWQDLEDAVRYARTQGARDVVVVGCSMGGSIVAQYLRRSKERAITRGAVLDSPALDWNAMIAVGARKRGVPTWVTELGKLVASLRAGFRWSDLVQARHVTEFETPMLILHGDADDVAPIAVSEQFAAALPRLVTFDPYQGAGHVESANVDPERYRKTVANWLMAHWVGRTGPEYQPIRR